MLYAIADMKTIVPELAVSLTTFTSAVGGYNVSRSLNLKSGSFVAVFNIDSYINCGYKPVASYDVKLTQLINLYYCVARSASKI